jgi:hypothetical protein
MTGNEHREPSAGTRGIGLIVLGATLVLIGGFTLLGQALDIDIADVAWPSFVIVPGVVLLAFGVSTRGGSRGPIVAGSVVTATGLVLLYQNGADRFESWAYAWALVGMVAPGLGHMLYGSLSGHRESVSTGRRTALIGLGFLAIGFVFFELVIGIGGEPGPLRDIGLPLLLIALGIWAVLGGYLARRS